MITSTRCIRSAVKYKKFFHSHPSEVCLAQLIVARISEQSDRPNGSMGSIALDDPLDMHFDYTPKDFLADSQQDTQDWMANESPITKALQLGRRMVLSNKKPTKDGLEEVYGLFLQGVEDLTVKNIDNVIWILATLDLLKSKLAEELQKYILNNIQVLSPSQKAIIMWGFTKAGIRNSTFWDGMIANIDISSHMSHVDFAHTVWSLAKQRIYLNKVWEPLESEVQKIVDDIYTSINLSILIWSFARADKGSKFLWDRFEQNFQRMLDRMGVNSLSSCVWAFASRNTVPPKMEFVEEIILKNSDMKAHEITCFLYCFAKLKIGSLEVRKFLLDQIYSKLTNKTQNWSLVTVCTLVYSLGRIYPVDDKIWDSVEKLVINNKKEIALLEKEHQYMLLDGIGRSRRMKGDIGTFLEELALKLVNSNFEQESAAICWHFGVNYSGSDSFWASIKESASKNLPSLPPHNIAILFWALVKTDRLDKTMKTQILEVLLTQVDKLERDDLLQVLWCLGRLNIDPLVKTVIIKFKEKFVAGIDLEQKDCHQFAYTLSRVTHDDLLIEKAFWDLLNQMLLKSMPNFDEDGFVFLSATIANSIQNFSRQVLVDYDKFCSQNINNFKIQTVCKLGLSLLRHREKFPKIWEQIIAVVQEKSSELTSKDFAGEFLTKLFEYKIGGPEFLKDLDGKITANIGQSPKKPFLKIVNSFTKAKQGSPSFWDTCLLRAKALLESETMTGDDLFVIAISLGNRRKGDKGVWNQLEAKLGDHLDSITPLRTARIASLYLLNRKIDPKIWQLLLQRVSSSVEPISMRVLGFLYSNSLKSESVCQKDKLLVKSLIETKLLSEPNNFIENIDEINALEANVYSTFDNNFRIQLKETMAKFLESGEGKILNKPVRSQVEDKLEAFGNSVQRGDRPIKKTNGYNHSTKQPRKIIKSLS